MGVLDSIGNFLTGGNGLSGFLQNAGGVANLAGGMYDLYSGIQENNAAEKYRELTYGTAAKQDAYADILFNREQNTVWPLEELQLEYSKNDLMQARPSYQSQLDYQYGSVAPIYGEDGKTITGYRQTSKGRMDEQLEQAKVLNPIIDDTERTLIRKLVEGEDVIAERMMNQATADVNIAYGTQRAQDQRAMGIAGINPNSGQFSNYLNQMGISQASTNAGARTAAARDAEELAINRQSTALNYAKGAQLPTYQLNPTTTTSTVMQGLGGAAPTYSGLMTTAAGNSQQSMNGFWTHLSNLTGNQSTALNPFTSLS